MSTRYPLAGVNRWKPKRIGIAVGVSGMLIHTAEGKRSIDEDLVLCIDRHRGRVDAARDCLFAQRGQVTGILETSLPDDDSPLLAA